MKRLAANKVAYTFSSISLSIIIIIFNIIFRIDQDTAAWLFVYLIAILGFPIVIMALIVYWGKNELYKATNDKNILYLGYMPIVIMLVLSFI